MKGNSFFKHADDKVWFKDVQEKMSVYGSEKENKDKEITEEEVEEYNKVIDMYQTYIDQLEPKSNRGLEGFKTREEFENIKKVKEREEAEKLKKEEAEKAKKKQGAKEVKKEQDKKSDK